MWQRAALIRERLQTVTTAFFSKLEANSRTKARKKSGVYCRGQKMEGLKSGLSLAELAHSPYAASGAITPELAPSFGSRPRLSRRG